MISAFKEVFFANVNYVEQTLTAWGLVGFSHVIGLDIEPPPLVFNILPYLQFVSLLLACAASIFTMAKIFSDIKSKGNGKD